MTSSWPGLAAKAPVVTIVTVVADRLLAPLARRYRARRRAFDGELARVPTQLSSEERRAVANMRGRLPALDQLEPTPRARPVPGSVSDEDRATTAARASLYRRFADVADSLSVQDETLDRRSVMARLATERDPAARRALFEGLAPLWRLVDGDADEASPYRRLLRASAARWAAHGSPVERNAIALGMPPASVEATLQAHPRRMAPGRRR